MRVTFWYDLDAPTADDVRIYWEHDGSGDHETFTAARDALMAEATLYRDAERQAGDLWWAEWYGTVLRYARSLRRADVVPAVVAWL
jgi:hypothetical protein